MLLILTTSHINAEQTNTVDVFYAKPQPHQQTLSLTGNIEAKQNAQLAPLQSGVVAKLLVDDGDIVSKGQILMKLDDKLASLTLAQSKAQVSAAQLANKEANRLLTEVIALSEKQLVAPTLIEERRSAVQITHAELASRKAQQDFNKENLARHSLYAPFDGVIAKRNINLGEWVSPQTPAFNLVGQDKLRVNLAIPQQYFHLLNESHTVAVTVTPNIDRAKSIDVSLTKIVNVASDITRTVTGFVDLPTNTSSRLFAGLSATVEIHLPEKNKPIVWLPKSALKQHPDGGNSVFTVVNNQAKRILVKVIEQSDSQVAVQGASTQTPFIVSGVELLKDGDPVVINKTIGNAQ